MLERDFHNGLRLLLNIDRHELVREGVIQADDHNSWGEFRRDPFRYFIRVDDEKAARIWAIMERRMNRCQTQQQAR
jgi:hypothetical protein